MKKNVNLKQSLIDFSELWKKLRIKLPLFETPEKVLSILDWKNCEESQKVREKIDYLLWLKKELEEIKTKYIEEKFWFENLDWKLARNISNFAFEFNVNQINDLKLIVKLIEQFYLDRIDLLQNNEEIQKLFWIDDFSIVNNLELPIFTRLDMVVNENRNLKLVEIEPIYAWIWETLWTRNVYNNLNKKDENFVWLKKSYINALKRFNWKNILFCPNPELSWYYNEVKYLFKELKPEVEKFSDFNLCLDFNNLEFKNNWIYFNWKKVDILMNYFIPKEKWVEIEFDRKILQEYKKWNIKLFPQPSLELDSKLWLCLAWNNKYFKKTDLYDKFIPNTKIFDENTKIDWDKMLKRVTSSLKKNDFFDTSIWFDEKLIKKDNLAWIIQDKISTLQKKIIIMNRKWKIEEKTFFSRIEVYIFFTNSWAELWDVLVTMWPREIVKWSRDCVMVPWVSKI